jgi:hypothetical protein
MSVPVLDGPFEGTAMNYPIAPPASVTLKGDGVPEGYVARYRYNPKKHGYVFKGIEVIVPRVLR